MNLARRGLLANRSVRRQFLSRFPQWVGERFHGLARREKQSRFISYVNSKVTAEQADNPTGTCEIGLFTWVHRC